MNENELNRFLKNLYDLLEKQEIITKKPSTSKEKVNITKDYIEKLERVNKKALELDRIEEIRRLYYKKYLIKEENILDSYWKHLEESYLAEGYGHVNLVNPNTYQDKELKREHTENIIKAQKDSLDAWLNYLLSPDSNYLEMWAKVWAFQGMITIGNLTKEKDKYTKRDNTTTNPFIGIDSEILGKSVELLKKILNKETIEDSELQRIAKTESFFQIYTRLLLSKKEIKTNGNEGKWFKYHEGNESEGVKLYNDLQGYNTGWCTAATLDTAIDQVCGKKSYVGGDFYVYYTKNENNGYKIPRIAIRTEHGRIGEIRGIAKNQNLESEMEDILEEKLKEFPDKEEYLKKVSDMKELTKIYKEHKIRELTKEEIRFLYEIDSNITGFGYQKDPRIEEITKTRNIKKDLSYALDCTEEEIGIAPESYEGKVYYKGDIDLYTITKTENLKLPKYVSGYLNLNSLTSAEGLILPKNVGGDLNLYSLTSAEGLIMPNNVGGHLNLRSLTSAEDLTLPNNIGGTLYLNSLTSAEGLIMPNNIGESLWLDKLTSAEGLALPNNIGGDLYLNSLTSAEGLTLPNNIGGTLYLNSLISAEGITLPNNVGRDLYLNSLTSAEGLTLPNNIVGDLYLNSLTIAEGLTLPNNIGGTLYLNSLISAEGLTLPNNVGRYLFFNSLKIADLLEIKLPLNIGGKICLQDGEYTLEELKNLIQMEKEKRNLQNQKQILESVIEDNSPKR